MVRILVPARTTAALVGPCKWQQSSPAVLQLARGHVFAMEELKRRMPVFIGGFGRWTFWTTIRCDFGHDRGPACHSNPRTIPMLETIAVILIILWLLGLVSSYTMGGFIHVLLALAIISVLVRLIRGRNP
jgi:hypothetical protein